MQKPAEVPELQKGAKLSDVAKQHAIEATETNWLRATLEALQQWVREQEAIN